jgi:hypothetical protein
MAFKGKAKADYQRGYMREYMRARRAAMRSRKPTEPPPSPEPAKAAPPPGGERGSVFEAQLQRARSNPGRKPRNADDIARAFANIPPPPPPPPPPCEATAAEKARLHQLRVWWKKAGGMDRSYRLDGTRAFFDKSRKYHAAFVAEIALERIMGKAGFQKWCIHELKLSPHFIAERSKIFKNTPELQEQLDLANMARIQQSVKAKSIKSATTCLGLTNPLFGANNEYVEYLWKRLGR